MYKNQKYYFTEPKFPDAVVLKSNKIISERINRKPQKIKLVKKEKKKVKGIKELEREKLMKLYGKNNNMIALLILLLKRADNKKDTKKYKSKGTYGRGGYRRKGNNYQTKTELDKQRKTETSKADKIKKDEQAFKASSKLLKEATNPNISPSQRKLLLEQAEKIAQDRITEEEFEKYKGYVSGASAEAPTKRAVLDIKVAVEKEIALQGDKNKAQLKEKQNKGRLDKKLEKDKRYKEFIDDIIFQDILSREDRDDFFKRFKTDNPDISKPSYDGFMKLFNPKYSDFKQNYQFVGQQQAKKISLIEKRKLKIKGFVESIKFSQNPSNKEIRDLVAKFKSDNPDIKNQPTQNEIISFIKISPGSDSGSDKSQNNIQTDFDDMVNSTFKDNSHTGMDDKLEKVKEYISKKENEKDKEQDKDKKKKNINWNKLWI